MDKLLCIYHGHCDDGFAAAWVVRHFLGDNVEFFAGQYGRPLPDVAGRDVLFVDFSCKRPALEAMARVAHSILILDHHKTAQEDLAWLPTPPPSFKAWRAIVDNPQPRFICAAAVFDMWRSGAGLTWDYLSGGAPRPRFIDYIEDRDLWHKQLPQGDEFTIALRSYPQDFVVWDELIGHIDRNGGEEDVWLLINAGNDIQRYYRMRVEELKRSAYKAVLGGAPV
jgi:hypothetical protein